MAFQGTTRTGKPVQVGDLVSITGVVTAVTAQSGVTLSSGNLGAAANLTILCSGTTNGPTDLVTGAYSYTITNTAAGTAVPTVGVYAEDVTATQSL